MDEGALEGVSHIIHLAGEPVAQRWSDATRARIRNSRTGALNLLKAACENRPLAPKVVSASAVGLYGSGPNIMTESSPIGEGFLADVVREWESAAEKLGQLGGGHVVFRIGLVLSENGGVLERLLPHLPSGFGRTARLWLTIPKLDTHWRPCELVHPMPWISRNGTALTMPWLQ